MTPPARLQAAIEVLDAWRSGIAVEQALSRWARGARYAGSGDRAAVRDHVFDVMRCLGNCTALGGGDHGRALVIGLLRLQGRDPEGLFTGARHAPAPLKAAEGRSNGKTPDRVRDVPAWCLPALKERFGNDIKELLQRLQARAPLFLRVNERKASVASARRGLAEDGIEAEPDPLCPGALRVTAGGRRLRQARAWREGLVEPQDLSVQRAVRSVSWPEDGRILDYCAGGGGKSLAIANRSRARLFAYDADPQRMADLPARARRAGVDVRICVRPDLEKCAPFDAVLCDVPCSGSGIWRRDPEAKWTLTPDRLQELESIQTNILRDAAQLVTRAGILVYMTCSMLRSENEDRIEAFRAGDPDWQVRQMSFESPLVASDGFFCAVLTRD